MTFEYLAAPASKEFDALLDTIEAQGRAAAQANQKPNLKGIAPRHRCFYMSAYRRATVQR